MSNHPMPVFYYQARNAQGQPVAGEVRADSVRQALAKLEADGLIVESIGGVAPTSTAPTSTAPTSAAPTSAAPAVGSMATGESTGDTTRTAAGSTSGMSAEQAALCVHMTTVLERSQALVPALRAFAEELTATRPRREFRRVLEILERNDPVGATVALETLPEYWIPLLSAASTSQDPGRVLSGFLNEYRRATALRQQTWRSLAYPIGIIGMAAAVFALFSFLVLPTFQRMFTDFNLRLPGLTLLLFELGALVTSGRIVIALLVVLVFGWLLVQATRRLPLPLQVWFGDRFGTPLGRATALARFTQFTTDLLEAKLEIPSALRIAGHATRNGRLRRASWKLASEIERNERYVPSNRVVPLTHTVLHALRFDMPTSARIRLLREVSVCYADRARSRLSWTRGMFEPVAICVLGVIVGGAVLALFLPLITLVHALTGG